MASKRITYDQEDWKRERRRYLNTITAQPMQMPPPRRGTRQAAMRSPSRASSRSPSRAPSRTPSRSPSSSPYSSAPSLIIELEKPKVLDESEDFYDALFRKILEMFPHTVVSDRGAVETNRRSTDRMDLTEPVDGSGMMRDLEEIDDISEKDMSIEDLEHYGGIHESMDRNGEDPQSSHRNVQEREIEVMRTPRIQRHSTGGTIEQHTLRQSDEASRSNIEPRIDYGWSFTSTPIQSDDSSEDDTSMDSAPDIRSSSQNADSDEHCSENRNSDDALVLEGNGSDEELDSDDNDGVNNTSENARPANSSVENAARSNEPDERSSLDNDSNEVSPQSVNLSDENLSGNGNGSASNRYTFRNLSTIDENVEDNLTSTDRDKISRRNDNCDNNSVEDLRGNSNGDTGASGRPLSRDISVRARNSNEISARRDINSGNTNPDENLRRNSNGHPSVSYRNSNDNSAGGNRSPDDNLVPTDSNAEENLSHRNRADRNDDILATFSRSLPRVVVNSGRLKATRKRKFFSKSALRPKKPKIADAAVQTDFQTSQSGKIWLLEPIRYKHTISDD